MKVENNYLHYFKTEADSKNVSTALGGVSLETVDWVRPYDSTAGVCVCVCVYVCVCVCMCVCVCLCLYSKNT